MPDVPNGRAHRAAVAVLAVVAALIDLGDLYWFGFTARWLAAVVVAAVAFGVSVTWRRRRPVAALAVAGLGYLVAWGIALPEPRPLSTLALAAVWVVAFSTIAEGTGRMRLAATAALGACVAMEAFQNLQWFSADPVTPAIVAYEAMTFTFVPLVLVAAANTVRSRIQLATAQATQAERLRELDARAAAHDERLRLARELHDVVANRLSAVAMRITAASHVRRAPATPEGTVLDEIGREIDSALGELRSMLGTLRSDRDGTDHTAPPSLENVRELADQARRAGADVAVVVSGRPVPLPSMLDLAAYRIVQEALTNVTRHARPPHATITVDYRADSVHLRIDDNGTDTGTVVPPGHGIIGIHERAALCGGQATAGPRPAGGWTVEAALPLPERTT